MIGEARVRSASYTGSGLLLVACVLLAVSTGHWSWPLFVWGALLGPVATYANYAAGGVGYATLKQATGAPDQLYQAVMARREARLVPRLVSNTVTGLAIGIVSAGVLRVWPLVVATVLMIGFGTVLPLYGARLVARRFAPTQGPPTHFRPDQLPPDQFP